jgi:transcriptional/translational regulatory protein YebC/TACO1
VLGGAGSNKFLFDHCGIVEAHHPDPAADREAAAIEAGANEFEELDHARNDDIPEGATGVRLLTDRTAVHAAASWLKQHGWTVVTAELGYIAKTYPELDDNQRAEVGEFLQEIEDNDDVQRVWAAVR